MLFIGSLSLRSFEFIGSLLSELKLPFRGLVESFFFEESFSSLLLELKRFSFRFRA